MHFEETVHPRLSIVPQKLDLREGTEQFVIAHAPQQDLCTLLLESTANPTASESKDKPS